MNNQLAFRQVGLEQPVQRMASHGSGTVASSKLLDVDGVTLRYVTGRTCVTAIQNVSFGVNVSERLVLLGQSGCGKSTLLKAIGGYMSPSTGTIRLNGETITKPGPDRVMVFQEFDQLLPWLTVQGNVEFALLMSGRARAKEARDRANRYIDKVHLSKFRDAYPHTLSGGMKQRVAIARAMAMEPAVLLMDEPYAALDALTRRKMQDELLELWNDTRFTMVFITHSITEAVKLGSRILVLSPHPGRLRAEIADVEADSRDLARSKLLEQTIDQLIFGSDALGPGGHHG